MQVRPDQYPPRLSAMPPVCAPYPPSFATYPTKPPDSARLYAMNHGDPQEFADRLVEKSVDHFVASLETINRITAPVRFETFTSQLATAWELLIKAKLVVDAGDSRTIYLSDAQTKRVRTKSLHVCIGETFDDNDQDVQLNLTRLNDFRNHSTHLVLPALPSNILRLFQTTVFNYERYLWRWHSVNLTERVPYGFVNVVFDIRSADWRFTDSQYKEHFNAEAINFIDSFVDTVEHDATQWNDPSRYRIPLEYKLAYTKKPDDAQFLFTGNSVAGHPTVPVERAIQPSSKYPYRFTKIVELLKSTHRKFSSHSLTDVIKAHSIKGDLRFHFSDPDGGAPDLYSEEFLNWLTIQVKGDSNFLTKARHKRRALDAKRRQDAPAPEPPTC